MRKISEKNIKSMVVGARQSFRFFRQKSWFFGNNRLNLISIKHNLIEHNLISITKLKKISP